MLCWKMNGGICTNNRIGALKCIFQDTFTDSLRYTATGRRDCGGSTVLSEQWHLRPGCLSIVDSRATDLVDAQDEFVRVVGRQDEVSRVVGDV